MKFSLEAPARVNLIRGYAAGEVRIGATVYRGSLIVAADTLITDWPVCDATRLGPADCGAIENLVPAIVLLGTGDRQVFPDPRLLVRFSALGIGLEVMDNGAACRTYNVLVSEGRRVACALILPATA
ncbi:MAG: Mth938-like domain-containing protein [Gammaproteobacteria bacterium]|nr:Mth938-like domain-containing protein [Gammaproteobacteria bacterium]